MTATQRATADWMMRKNLLAGLIIAMLWGILGVTVPLRAIAAEQTSQAAHDLLAQMDDAFVRLSYDGVFSYFSGNDLATLRVVHKVVDGVQRERLVHLNGAPREIIRQGEDVSCLVMPGDDLLALADSIPAGPFARAFVRQFERLSTSYLVDHYGEGRVAGRPAIRIGVSPLDQHRYGYRLWLDKATSLLLRSELVDADGNKLEIFQFTQLQLGDAVTVADLEPQEVSGSTVSHMRLETGAADLSAAASEPASQAAAWETTWLPNGFEMATADIRRKPAHAVTNLVYSDGLAAFSIFIEPMPETGAASMVSQNGATVALTHRVGGQEGYHLVTLVGEIPVATAHEIIKSVKQKSL
ncbi:MAG: MucB/RseB C-terminal domain-containing protein [Pseudomonadota bacterium]